MRTTGIQGKFVKPENRINGIEKRIFMDNVVKVSGITKDYAGEKALAGVSFTVKTGTLFGFIGADGAGKTTLLRILATLITPDKGSASVLGFDTQKEMTSIRRRIGYMPQRFSLYPDLSVMENLEFFADIFGVSGGSRKNKVTRLLEFSRLTSFKKRRASHLSGGMKQKLALSCALVHTPGLLILDEPTTGVDPVSRNEFWDILHQLKSEGITILVSTPYMDEADMCDEISFMKKGEIAVRGTPEGLRKQYPLKLFGVNLPSGKTVSIQSDARLPEKIKMAYPVAGELHLSVSDPDFTSFEVRSAMQNIVPDEAEITEVEPSIEDLFFYYNSEAMEK